MFDFTHTDWLDLVEVLVFAKEGSKIYAAAEDEMTRRTYASA